MPYARVASGVSNRILRLADHPAIRTQDHYEIDLSRCTQPRQMHITGHYNRFDIFDLRVNRRAPAPSRPPESYEGAEQLRP